MSLSQPNHPGPSTARRWIVGPVIGLFGVVAYLPQCTYPFVYDDVSIISKNPTVTGGAWLDCLTEPYWPRDLGFDPLYRPVTTASLRLNYALFGDRPLGYRVTNALLHAVCSALVALLALRLWPAGRGGGEQRRRGWVGWIAGLVFAVHPLHAEAVALVVGRAELLAALFSLWLIYRHVGYLAGPRRPSIRYHLITTLLLLLAIGSKEHAVLIFPAVVGLDIWARRTGRTRTPFRERVNRLARSRYLGLIAAVAGFLFARWLIFGGHTTLPADLVSPLANPLVSASAVTQVAAAAALLFLALRLFFLPIGLCPIWSVGGFDLPAGPWRADVLIGALLAMAMIGLAIVGLRRRWTTGLLVGLTGLFVILPCHFVPAANWLFAERWLYLPSAFLTLVVVRLISILPRPRAVFAAMLLAVGGLFAINWQYQQSWRSNLDLGRSVIARHPDSYHGLIAYVHGLKDRGELASAKEQIDRLIERFPHSPRSWYYQALLMDALDRPQEALDAIGKYVWVDGPNPLTKELTAVRKRARSRLEGRRARSP